MSIISFYTLASSSSAVAISSLLPAVFLCNLFVLGSKNQFGRATSASFFTTNGLKVFSNTDWLEEDPGTAAASESWAGDARAEFVLGFPKKLAIMDRDLFWASFSFFSFSALAAFFSSFSFSCRRGCQSLLRLNCDR